MWWAGSKSGLVGFLGVVRSGAEEGEEGQAPPPRPHTVVMLARLTPPALAGADPEILTRYDGTDSELTRKD